MANGRRLDPNTVDSTVAKACRCRLVVILSRKTWLGTPLEADDCRVIVTSRFSTERNNCQLCLKACTGR